jgi:hypothetical protein
VLPGQDRDGKISLLAKNYAENLVAAGLAVLCIDAPGTGERTGPANSHDAYLYNAATAGFAPAEVFVSEALVAGRVLNEVTGMAPDSIALIGVGEDVYTALYAGIINPGFVSLTLVGGLSPMADLATAARAPVEALVTGLGEYPPEAILEAAGPRRVRCYPLDPAQQAWALSAASHGAYVVASGSPDQFIKSGFEKSLQKIGEDFKNEAVSLASAKFTGISSQQKEASFTIGAQNLSEVSASFMDIPLMVRSKPNYIPADTPIIKTATFSLPWVTLPGSAPSAKRVLIWAESSNRPQDTALIRKAQQRGYRVCRLTLFDRMSGYQEARQRFYNLMLAGVKLDAQWKDAIRSVAGKTRATPDIYAADSLAALVVTRLVADTTLPVNRFIACGMRSTKASLFTGNLLDGYDGSPYADAAYINLPRLRASLVLREYRDMSVRDWLPQAAKAHPVCLYLPPSDSLGYDEEVPASASRITSADSLFR